MVVSDGFPDADATTAVNGGAAGELAQPPQRLVVWRDDECVSADPKPFECVRHSDRPKLRLLAKQRRRMNDHVARKKCAHAWYERAGAELREGVMPPVRRDHVVA